MGHPEWTDEPLFKGRGKRTANWDAARLFVQEWLQDQTVEDLYHKAQARRIPFAPVSTMGDLVNSEHLKARGFFVGDRSSGGRNVQVSRARCSR